MTNSSDMDNWLAENKIPLETYNGIMQSGNQLIFTCPTIESFRKAILDWQATYSKELVSKCNSGIGKFTYIIAGQTKGYAITISDTAQAPGVVVRMGFLEDIHGWFDQHTGTRAFVKDAVKFGLGYAILKQADILASLPIEYLAIGTMVFGAVGWLHNYAQTHTVWPIIGAHANSPAGKFIKNKFA